MRYSGWDGWMVARQYTDMSVAPERPSTAETPPSPVALVSLADIELAAERLQGIVVRTPLLPFGRPAPGDVRGRSGLYLKPESLQPIGSFKIRGAYNAIASLSPELQAAGVVSHSSGNHAQGVSRAARLLGLRAVIVMPRDTPAIKVRAVEADGAEIVWVGPSSEERAERAGEIARGGMALVPSYDDPAIIAGQGTAGLEIVAQLREELSLPSRDVRNGEGSSRPEQAQPPFCVIVPVGGGGLASGIAVAVKSLAPDARVFGVEPELAADARDSLRQGRIVRWEPELVARTSADGMRTTALGQHTFAHVVRYLDGILTVSELEIARAMARAAREARLVLEPSGATSLAALLFHRSELPGDGPIVCVLSGGNVDPDRFTTMVAEADAAGD
jgi:threonine dehydratase